MGRNPNGVSPTARSVFDLPLQELDLVRTEVEKAIDPVIQFGLCVHESTRESGVLVTFLLQVRLPLVGELGVLHGVRRELEALLQRVAKLIQRKLPPSLGLLVQWARVASGEGLEKPAMQADLPLVAFLAK